MMYFIWINIVSLIMYGYDKIQALRKKYRIPEKVLIVLALAGGCYGSFLGMLIFHHKIRKIKFIIIIPILMAIWTTILMKG